LPIDFIRQLADAMICFAADYDYVTQREREAKMMI
jgi:hypothetical protein